METIGIEEMKDDVVYEYNVKRTEGMIEECKRQIEETERNTTLVSFVVIAEAFALYYFISNATFLMAAVFGVLLLVGIAKLYVHVKTGDMWAEEQRKANVYLAQLQSEATLRKLQEDVANAYEN